MTVVEKQDKAERPKSVFHDLPAGPLKHFYSGKNKRLRATIAIAHNEDGTFDIGVARCNKDDMPTKAFGRNLAQERLNRLQLLRHDNRKALALADVRRIRREQKKKLALTLSKEELVEFINNNPFSKEIYCEEDFFKKASKLKVIQ